jgi:NADPH-dependent 2,4-dienoyl-CoA reductase/sulfur reductase-like enzyme
MPSNYELDHKIMAGFVRKIESSNPTSDEYRDRPSVQRYPLTTINVLVVGAGVGGLTAALECYRKGHNVRIFERESSITTAGN